jgi:hypothetical protein
MWIALGTSFVYRLYMRVPVSGRVCPSSSADRRRCRCRCAPCRTGDANRVGDDPFVRSCGIFTRIGLSAYPVAQMCLGLAAQRVRAGRTNSFGQAVGQAGRGSLWTMDSIDRGQGNVIVIMTATVFVRWTISRHRPGAIDRSIDLCRRPCALSTP